MHKNPENNILYSKTENGFSPFNEAIKLAKGEVAIPVQMNPFNQVGAPGYETPLFLSTNGDNIKAVNAKLAACSKTDIEKVNKRLAAAKNSKQRLNACN